MDRLLITHGLDDMELASLEVLGHKMKVITRDNAGSRLSELLEGIDKPSMGSIPDEKVIIFNGYEDEELQENVVKFRQIFPVRPILAVVTDHSRNWTFEYLLTEHLIKDRDANRENHRKYLEELEEENRKMAEAQKMEQSTDSEGKSKE